MFNLIILFLIRSCNLNVKAILFKPDIPIIHNIFMCYILGERPYVCPCGATFRDSGNFTNHKKKAHAKGLEKLSPFIPSMIPEKITNNSPSNNTIDM